MSECLSSIPKTSGIYVLHFNLEASLEVEVGRLGRQTLPAGHLLYVGSAFGPGGLRARITRHLKSEKRKHWHVDALTTAIPPMAYVCDASGRRLECRWAQRLADLPGAYSPVPGFGSSDCRSGCISHLIAYPVNSLPDLSTELVTPPLASCDNQLLYCEHRRRSKQNSNIEQ